MKKSSFIRSIAFALLIGGAVCLAANTPEQDVAELPTIFNSMQDPSQKLAELPTIFLTKFDILA